MKQRYTPDLLNDIAHTDLSKSDLPSLNVKSIHPAQKLHLTKFISPTKDHLSTGKPGDERGPALEMQKKAYNTQMKRR